MKTFSQISFVEDTNIPFKEITDGDIKFVDVDGDNDLDVFIIGIHSNNSNASSGIIAELYLNNGSGSFVLDTRNSFIEVYGTSISFFDIDGDKDLDLFISGQPSTGQPGSRLYTNDGTGLFTMVQNTGIIGVVNGAIVTADLDGDNDNDLLITGYKDVSDGVVSRLYFNDGAGNFVLSNNNPFIPVSGASSAVADIDGDNDLDIILSGLDTTNNAYITKLYINNGQGIFSLDSTNSFAGFYQGDITFKDLDNDGDNDVAFVGGEGALNIPVTSKIYINSGNGSFTEKNANYDSLITSDFSFDDVDNDGDLDLVIIGRDSNSNTISNLYLNDGSANFTLQSTINLLSVSKGDVAFGDVNNDKKIDILLTGNNTSSNGTITFIKLYLNQSTLSDKSFLVEDKSISTYPNPATSIINLKSNTNKIINSIEMYNVLGKKVLSKENNEQFSTLNISGFTKGVYMLKINVEGSIQTQKIIIQ